MVNDLERRHETETPPSACTITITHAVMFQKMQIKLLTIRNMEYSDNEISLC